jgi:hypothetical protein
VPIIGLAWWALDFPFMKRGRGRGARHSDLQTTRQACEKFKRIPTSVINFVEGTRITPAKHAAQRSPYRHLLKPKIGGLGIALATMGEMFEALLDVTIVYPGGIPSFVDLLCGRVGEVIVRVQRREIPPEVLGGDPIDDKDYRQRLSAWVEGQWQEKDALMARAVRPVPGPPPTTAPVPAPRSRRARPWARASQRAGPRTPSAGAAVCRPASRPGPGLRPRAARRRPAQRTGGRATRATAARRRRVAAPRWGRRGAATAGSRPCGRPRRRRPRASAPAQ